MTRLARAAGARELRRNGGRLVLGFACLAWLLLAAPIAWGETAWVEDEVMLNLRTGPGTQYRIKGSLRTGESVEVLSRGEGWTQVRTTSHGEGWIPEGFLQPEMPAAMRLEATLAETAEFRDQHASLTNRVKELETANAELSSTDAERDSTIESLTRENLELKAGARWPEWITGAGILCVGMLMGAIIQSMNGRRARPRIRL